MFSYLDTQITRLGGANFHEIPINAALAPVHNNQRDGLHRQAIHRGRVAYEPNSLAQSGEFRADGGQQGFQSLPDPVDSPKLRRRPPGFDDHFSQATLFWNSQSAAEREHLVAAFAQALGRVESAAIRQRMVDNLAHVDARLARKVAEPLGLAPPAGDAELAIALRRVQALEPAGVGARDVAGRPRGYAVAHVELLPCRGI